MDDLISRQAAIDTLTDYYHHRTETQHEALHDALSRVPSAQQEPCEEAQHILDYLDNVLHPLISPEHWNVYSELYDMIAALPYAQPDLARDIATIIENEKDMRVILKNAQPERKGEEPEDDS